TNPGPFEWDVKRLATSFVLAGPSLALAQKDRDPGAGASLRSDREARAEFAQMRNLELWYSRIDAQHILDQAANRFSVEEIRRLEQGAAEDAGTYNLHDC